MCLSWKWHLHQFSRFCTADPYAQHTDTQTTLRVTSVATHRQTDHATCDICSSRMHLCSACRQHNLTTQWSLTLHCAVHLRCVPWWCGGPHSGTSGPCVDGWNMYSDPSRPCRGDLPQSTASIYNSHRHTAISTSTSCRRCGRVLDLQLTGRRFNSRPVRFHVT